MRANIYNILIKKMKKVLFFLSLALIATYLRAQETDYLTISLWESPAKPVIQTAPSHRIPAIVRCSDNSLLAVCDYRYTLSDVGVNGSQIELQYRRSLDGGVSWTEAQTVCPKSSSRSSWKYAMGDASLIADRESGEVLMMCAAGSTGMGASSASNPIKIGQFRSSDNGQTWDEGEEITQKIYGLYNGNATAIFITSGSLLQSKLIKVGDYYRIYAAHPLRTSKNGNTSSVIYSDDFGRTWHVLGGAMNFPTNSVYEEAKVAEMPDGSVVMMVRDDSGKSNINAGKKNFNVFTYTNKEAGEGTWSTAVSGITGMKNACNNSILIVPARRVSDKQDVSVALVALPFHTNDTRDAVNNYGRKDVGFYYKVISSADDYKDGASMAANWQRGLQVTDKLSAYTDLVLLQNGNVGLLAEDNGKQGLGADGNAETEAYDIVFRSIPLTTITDGAYEYALPTTDVPSDAPYDYEVGGLFFRKISEGEAEVTFHDSASCVYYYNSDTDNNNPSTKHNYYSGDIMVPTQIETADGVLKVTRIGDWAFAYADGITSLTIPEGITSIGRGAFFRTDMNSISIPEGVTLVEERAFTGGIIETVNVASLKAWLTMKFKDSNSNPIWAGGGKLLIAGEPLTEVEIPDGIEEIGDFAFGLCPGITQISFPNSLRRIGRMAFYMNTEILSLDLPEGLEEVDYGAFNMCSGVTEILLPSTLRTIGGYGFAGCKVGSITLPAALESLGEYAIFQADESLMEILVDRNNTHFTTSNGILYTKDMKRLICYPNGKNDLEYTMPATVEQVDGSALCNNSFLTRIDISPALKRVGMNGLMTGQEVDLYVSDLAAFCRISLMGDDESEYYTPWNSFNLYVDGKLVTDLKIPEGITSLGRMQFIQCASIESVELPEGLTRVRQFAFGMCPNLKTLTLPSTTQELEFYAFGYAPLKEIHAHMTSPVPFETESQEQAYASLYNIQPFTSLVATLYVPVGTVELYKNTKGWNSFPSILEDTEENQPKEDVFKEIGRGTFHSAMLNRNSIAILSRSLTNPSHYRIAPFIYNEDGAVFIVAENGNIYMDNQSTGWDYENYGIIHVSDPMTYGEGLGDIGKAELYEGHDFYGTFTFNLVYFVSAGYFGLYTDTFKLEEMTGIEDIRLSGDSRLGNCYDLQGRRITAPAKGLFIQNGKKILR